MERAGQRCQHRLCSAIEHPAKAGIDIGRPADVRIDQQDAQSARGLVHRLDLLFAAVAHRCVDDHAHALEPGHGFGQHLHPLAGQRLVQRRHPGDSRARPCERFDEFKLYRVQDAGDDDRCGAVSIPGASRHRRGRREEHVDFLARQFTSQGLEPVGVRAGRASQKNEVPTFDKALFAQAGDKAALRMLEIGPVIAPQQLTDTRDTVLRHGNSTQQHSQYEDDQ